MNVTGALLAVVVAMALPAGPTEAAVGTVSVGGPYGGEIMGLSVSPHDAQSLFVSTTQGVFRSSNGGARWTPASSGLGNLAVHNAAFDADDPDIAYAATNGGMFRSTDGGASWSAAEASKELLTYNQAWAVQAVAGAVYASSRGSLIVSRDQGRTWSAVYRTATGSVGAWSVAPSNADIIYLRRETAEGDAVTVRSADGGASWQTSDLNYAGSIVVHPEEPRIAYADTFGGFAVTRDGGRSWSESGWEHPSIRYSSDLALGAGGTVMVTGAATTGRFVARSEDGGDTWTITRMAGSTTNPVIAVDATDDRIVYAGGYGDGVHRSIDGGATFERRNTGLTAQTVRAIASDPTNPSTIFASLGDGGMFGSTDGGTSWADLTSGIVDPRSPYTAVAVSAIAIDAAGVVYAARQAFDWHTTPILMTQDGGATWSSRAAGLPQDMQPTHLVAHPTNPGHLLATFRDYDHTDDHYVGRSFVTHNGGQTWSDVTGLPGPVNALHLDPVSGRMVAATGLYDGYKTDDRLYESSDFGQSWERLAYPAGVATIYAVTFDPTLGRIYAGGLTGSLFYTDDHGQSWDQLDVISTGNAPFMTVIAVDPVDNTQLFVGTRGRGLWFSRDRGRTWETATPGVAGQDVYTLTFPPRRSTVTVAASALTMSALSSTTSTTSTAVKHRAAFVGMNNRARSGLTRVLPRPHNRARPLVTGTLKVGRQVQCDPRWWTRTADFRYRWLRSGAVISGATTASYAVMRADQGKYLRCRVTGVGPGGRDAVSTLPMLVN